MWLVNRYYYSSSIFNAQIYTWVSEVLLFIFYYVVVTEYPIEQWNGGKVSFGSLFRGCSLSQQERRGEVE